MSSAVCSPPQPSFTNAYAYMDRAFTRDSNGADAPLPRIPRRTPPSSRLHSTTGSSSVHTTAAATALQNLFVSPPKATFVVQPPTPPASSQTDIKNDETSSSSSEGSYVEIAGTKSRRVHPSSKQLGVCPPEYSTPTPGIFGKDKRFAWPVRKDPETDVAAVSDQDDSTPRASSYEKLSRKGSGLRLDLSEIQSLAAGPSSEGQFPAGTTSAPLVRPTAISLGRKKSGEPLKSSLKSRRPVVRGDLSVVTGAMSSKSEPSTPTQLKSVHFDAQLEHVKLFLAEQKPLAISREGSPTDDTSGTDSDFPSFIYGGLSDDERIRKALAIDVTNLPPRISESADLALESLTLSEDHASVNGKVCVRNIAFEKWVAVRFTFDWWQTTSEVTAKYIESLPGGVFDRFSFSIRLNDMLKRIEEKTLFLAVRYTVAGREYWDSNSGQNYQVKFRLQKISPRVVRPPAPASTDSTPTPNAQGKLKDLKTKLEQVAISKGRDSVGGVLNSRRTVSANDGFTLKSGLPLSARYDFSASLRSPWRAASPFLDDRSRTNTYPNYHRRSYSEKKPFDSSKFASRGSPRIVDSEDSTPPSVSPTFYDEDTPVPQAILARRNKSSRHHQRGYFDLGVGASSSSVKRTPPGSPKMTPSGTPTPRSESVFRYNSFPPTDGSSTMRSHRAVSPASEGPPSAYLAAGWLGVGRGGSEESTPSITSTGDSSASSQSSSRDTSPVPSPLEGPLSMYADDAVDASNYNVFLNRFCFYTGSDSMLDLPIDALQRSHSASSVEELLSSPSPGASKEHLALSPGHTPTRSSSLDDVAGLSGVSTPTPAHASSPHVH